MLAESATDTLLAAGYSKADICHYVTTDLAFRATHPLMQELSHLRDDHDDLIAANCHVAVLTFVVTRAPDMAKTLKLLGDTREHPTNGPEILRDAIAKRDALAKKLADRAELEKEIDHLV